MTAPTKPPDKCPACGCTETKFDVPMYKAFRCGYEWYIANDREVAREDCTRSFPAAIALRAERDAALARAEKAEGEAQETYREFICPKCETEFEDDGKEHPNGLMCPECKGNVKGVIHPRTVKRYVSQSDWDALTARLAELQAENAAQQRNITFKANEIVSLRNEYNRMIAEFSALRAALASGAVVEGESEKQHG